MPAARSTMRGHRAGVDVVAEHLRARARSLRAAAELAAGGSRCDAALAPTGRGKTLVHLGPRQRRAPCSGRLRAGCAAPRRRSARVGRSPQCRSSSTSSTGLRARTRRRGSPPRRGASDRPSAARPGARRGAARSRRRGRARRRARRGTRRRARSVRAATCRATRARELLAGAPRAARRRARRAARRSALRRAARTARPRAADRRARSRPRAPSRSPTPREQLRGAGATCPIAGRRR